MSCIPDAAVLNSLDAKLNIQVSGVGECAGGIWLAGIGALVVDVMLKAGVSNTLRGWGQFFSGCGFLGWLCRCKEIPVHRVKKLCAK